MNNIINNFLSRKRNVIIFFLASVLLLISTLVFTNFEIIAYQVNKVVQDIKMALINVDGFEMSMVLIDQDRGEYNSSYTWNAYDYEERRTLTLQINYKKNNNVAYEPGDLVIQVPNMFTKQSYVYGESTSNSENATAISSNPCNVKEKSGSWNYSSNPTKCQTNTFSSNYDYLYFTNTEKIEANTNFEGSIRIKYYGIRPDSLINGLNNTFHASLNEKLNTNNITFRFTSNKRNYTLYTNNYKINGYDGLPSNASNYIWIKVSPNYSTASGNKGVRNLVYERRYPSETKPAQTGLSSQAYKYGRRIRLSLPSNAIFYSWNNAYTYETENGYGYYRYNANSTYYNGKHIGYGDSCFYIGLPKSQYTNTTVSYTMYMYGIYSDWNDYIDESKSHSYDYLGSTTSTINTSDYYYDTPSSDQLYSINYHGYYNALDPNNLRTGVDMYTDVKAIYTGYNYDLKIGNDVFYKKNSNGYIYQLSDNQYYYHLVTFDDWNVKDSNGNDIKPIYDVDLYVRYKNTSSFVKYGETFTNSKERKTFEFPDNNVVGFYFLIHNLDTSFVSSNGGSGSSVTFNAVFTNGSIYQGDTLYNSPYMEVYRHGYSYPIYTPSSSSYEGDIASSLRSYDNSTYGHYTVRKVSSMPALYNYTYIHNYSYTSSSSNYKKSVFKTQYYIHPELYSSYSGSYTVSRGFLKQNKGYEIYVYLPEGFYVDEKDPFQFYCSYSKNMFDAGYIKRYNGDLFTSQEDYCNYVKDRMTTTIKRNWKGTKRTLVKVKVDFTDAPLDYTDIHYYNNSISNDIYIPEYFYFNLLYDKENIAQYKKSEFEVQSFIKTIGGPTSIPSNGIYDLSRDELDVNEDGSTYDYMSNNSSKIYVYYTEESNQDIMTFIKSDDDEYNADHTLVSYNDNYSYKLRVRNRESKVTNLVIYDSIENYIKKNGQYEKAAGDITTLFSGTFQGVDTSYAQSQGYYVKVYYSESKTPGSLSSDSSWKVYYEGSTDKSKVKSLAFEYYNSSGSSKATLPKDTITYVEVKLKSPPSIVEDKTAAYNGCWVEWNAIDLNNNVVPNVVGINSNVVNVAIPTVLKVKHYYNGTTTEIAPEETFEIYGGSDYETKASTIIPSGYTFDHTDGDPAEGIITKSYTEVIYYYRELSPSVSALLTKLGYDDVDKRSDEVSYKITYTSVIKDIKGTANVTIVDQLPYEIDTSKPYDLKGGTYDAENRTITWTDRLSISSYEEANEVLVYNISLYYKDVPVTTGSYVNNVSCTTKMGSLEDTQETTQETTINEKYKLTVHHYYEGTTDSIAEDEIIYKYGGDTYETSPADVSLNYEITVPDNAVGAILSEETEVTYYYKKRDLVLTTTLDKTGPGELDNRKGQVSYQIAYNANIKDYVGTSTLSIVDTLPYQIDTTKEYNLDGGTYDAENKTITWNKEITTTKLEESDNGFTFNISFSYLNIPIATKDFTNKVNATLSIDETTDTKEVTKKTDITAKYKLTVHHYYVGTTDSISPDVISYLPGGEQYVTSPADVSLNYEIIPPTYPNGAILDEETEVTYYYNKRNALITASIDMTGPDTLSKRKEKVNYQITYNAMIKDYVGTTTVQIVDTLPYEIDTSKEYDLDGGTYDAQNKTITWNKEIKTTALEESNNNIQMNVSFSYLNIGVPVRSITNKVTSTANIDDKVDIKEKTKTTNITEQFKLTVHHYYQGTTNSISPDVVTYKDGGAAYNTSPASVPADYDIITPDNSSGTINLEETVVTYLYQRKDPNLNGNATIDGTESISTFADPLEYEISYETTVADYVGNVEVTIVDTLPYEIDTEKEYELDGGTYDETNKTITWTENFNKTNISSETKTYTHNVSFIYKDVLRTDKTLTNSVDASTTLDNKNIEKNTSYATNIEVMGKIIVKYINISNNEELDESVESEDLIYTNKYVPESKSIDTFDLVEIPSEEEYDYLEEEQILYYKYKKRKHTILTKVMGSNGTIQGDEEVDEGSDSTKDNIVIKAAEGYEINRIMINGEELGIDKGLLVYTVNNFKDVREDKTIAVEFIKTPVHENPPTGSFMSTAIIISFITGFMFLYLFAKNYVKFKSI